ncbi:MAG: DUF3593 domain-containing protein [Cyanobacteriota bacterium]|nr:DUF3593 domain-containing protein [Cyanobacteriota bacterium]
MSAPLSALASIDPTPLFVLSLLPYLAFLWWASRIDAFPRLALKGFQFTLVFVAVTIAAAIVAQLRYGELLANVDPLHGGAESLLTVANLLVVLGFSGLGGSQGERRPDR